MCENDSLSSLFSLLQKDQIIIVIFYKTGWMENVRGNQSLKASNEKKIKKKQTQNRVWNRKLLERTTEESLYGKVCI